jgi:hypothetical protein
MNHEATIENIKAELNHVDAAALQSIWEIIARAKRKPAAAPEPAVGSTPSHADKTTATSEPLQFVGENLTLEEYERLRLKNAACYSGV